MKTKWKAIIGIVVLLVVAAGVFASVKYSQKGIVTVQTGRAVRQDLASIVTASGEIKPRNYINIGANAQGELTGLLVKEGDHVRKGQLLARIENVQPAADVETQRATISSAEADAAASEASQKAAEDNLATMQATVDRSRADLEKAEVDFNRYKDLFDQKLVAKQEYDQRRTTLESQKAAVREAEARMVQAKAQIAQAAAQTSASQRRIAQSKSSLVRFNDLLNKRNVISPLDGVVTNLPVRMGEVVVPGIQNSASSTIMTIADMSIITAEVKVDESDIVNVKLDQIADVTVDAIQAKVLKGRVIEIGNTAILRSTGLAASQSSVSSQEAKDFKVVIALDNPPDEIRPGLSCSSKITTSQKAHIVTVPIQALTSRQKGDLGPKTGGDVKPSGVAQLTPAEERARKVEVPGVFVIENGHAKFTKVETGITGNTDIEVTSGLSEGAQILTGPYQVIRTIRDNTTVKVDNTPPGAKPAN